MAKNLDSYLADRVLTRQLYLMRFSAGEKKKVLAVLVDMRAELVAKLRAGNVTDFTRQRLQRLLTQCEAVIEQAFNKIQTTLDFDGLAKAEAEAAIKPLAAVGLEASLPTAAVLKAVVSDTLLQGAPLKDWWAKQSADTAFKFSAQVRQGVAQGETLQQVITRIVGSKKKGIVGIMEISHRHASTLVHDSIMQIANDARMATYKANADIMKGFEWLATLDGNTCVQCMAYSGAQWDMEGKPIKGDLPLKNPPLHPNCRCVLTPLTKSYRELGLNIDEMPPGTRASDLGQVPADMSMDSFLRRHDTEYLNDLLGPGRAKLFQDGKITLRQLVDGTGRPLRLDELRKAA